MALTQIPTALVSQDSGLQRAHMGADAAIPTGVVWPFAGSAAPAGWVLASGRTIGNASSGATERANADTVNLFTLLWTSFANTEATVSGGRGASAAADFAANKTIVVPDGRGRVIAGKDDMGGTAANRLTASGTGNPGIAGTTLGASGGADRHVLTVAQMPAHTHTVTGGSASGGTGSNDVRASGNATGAAPVAASQGNDNAHPNAQPTLVLNHIIKL